MSKLVLVFAIFAACARAQEKAIVTIAGEPGVSGVITFTQTPNGMVVDGEVKGLTPGKHGFHVHEKGDLSKGCISAGSHFNPFNKKHGAPTAEERHVGDLGNIEADSTGVAKVAITDKLISLGGETCILGRAIVVHSGVDDLGLGGNEESLKTGNAGSRVGCGVIGVLFGNLTTTTTPKAPQVTSAVVSLQGEHVTGTITFRNSADGAGVVLIGQVTGLTGGKHGFHIHALGDLSNGCASTAAHFNPFSKNHGAPNATERHVGDLGNIDANAPGITVVDIYDRIISLSGETGIIGRAVVVHSGADDLGLGGNSESLVTGNAGSRVACGVIGIASEEVPDDSGVGHMTGLSWTLVLSTVSLLSTFST